MEKEELYKQINLLQQENNVLRQSISKLEEYYKWLYTELCFRMKESIFNKKQEEWDKTQLSGKYYITFDNLKKLYDRMEDYINGEKYGKK